jgi:subtilisin family serine protease
LFAAGNGNENCDVDEYISNPDVIAIAACNDQGKRSIYSDYGKCIWVSFPSSDWDSRKLKHPRPLTKGIWTTDRVNKKGYNRKSKGNYCDDFGGTSSAAPGVAGVVALMLSANPDLSVKQVRQILKNTADKIDISKGRYRQGHSIYYGYGRVNAEKAVKKAISMKH